jgi:Holliday junction resolvase RusA-like endonuclease
MIRTCEFRVEGQPRAKGRPRFNMKSGRAYTDVKTREYEKRVKSAAWAAMRREGLMPTAARCSVIITCNMEVPKSYTKQKKIYCHSGVIVPPRPDVDNLIKSALDGANEIVFVDDAQVWHVSAFKKYVGYDETPHMHVKIQWEDGSE